MNLPPVNLTVGHRAVYAPRRGARPPEVAVTSIVQRFSVRPFFRWFDIWIGAYWDRENWTLYICPVPMFGLKIKIPRRREYHSNVCIHGTHHRESCDRCEAMETAEPFV
jgi:hypothetical protein